MLCEPEFLKYLLRDPRRTEKVGPQSDYPFLAIDLSTFNVEPAAKILRSLPCPIIGVGGADTKQVCDVIISAESKLTSLAENIRRTPYASTLLVQTLRLGDCLPISQALVAESLAYGLLQAGPEFKQWLEQRDSIAATKTHRKLNPLIIDTSKQALKIKLNNPNLYNVIDVNMRDALTEALEIAIADSNLSEIYIYAVGRAFSIGGDVREFGSVSDPTTAHIIRSSRLPAQQLAQLSERLNVHVNGAAIGAGVEMAAFASKVTASPSAWFQLPELRYGLIPGAGGTVSLSRRIGRQKTAYMALSMSKIRATTALQWGLIDKIVDQPSP